MKVTHIDYQHPKHLRVEDGSWHDAFTVGLGNFKTNAICVSPNSELYTSLYRPDLPTWPGYDITSLRFGDE